MKSIEQIAMEVAKDTPNDMHEEEWVVWFATKFLEAYLAQQTPIAYVYLHDIQRSREMGTYAAAYPVQVRTVVDKSVPVFLASPTSPEGFENAINEAVKAEREACAAECERMVMYPGGKQEAPAHDNVWAAAKAIRERGEKK